MHRAEYPGSLSSLQQELLRALDVYGDGFFLTGGAALAGFYGSARPTRDLDLFTRDPEVFKQASRVVDCVAQALMCEMENLRTFPHFRRYRFRKDDEAVVLDFVREEVSAVYPPVAVDGWKLRVDRLEEMAINKICALVSRGEVRDLEDLEFMAKAGIDLGSALTLSVRKDGGIGSDTLLIGLQSYAPSVLSDTVERFRQKWIEQLKAELYRAEPP